MVLQRGAAARHGLGRLKLWKGTLNVTKRLSPYSLYRADLASFTMGRYNPKDAEGSSTFLPCR